MQASDAKWQSLQDKKGAVLNYLC